MMTRAALRILGFENGGPEKRETRERITETGDVLQVRLSHKGNRDSPPGTHADMLRQAGIDRETFQQTLRG